MPEYRPLVLFAEYPTGRLLTGNRQPLAPNGLTLWYGEAIELTVAIRDTAGQPVDLDDLASHTLTLAIKRPDDLDGSSLLLYSAAGTVADLEDGLTVFQLATTNTANLAAYLADPLAPPGYGLSAALTVLAVSGNERIILAAGTVTVARLASSPTDSVPGVGPTIMGLTAITPPAVAANLWAPVGETGQQDRRLQLSAWPVSTPMTTELNGKAALVHTHEQSAIIGLVTALSGKAPVGLAGESDFVPIFIRQPESGADGAVSFAVAYACNLTSIRNLRLQQGTLTLAVAKNGVAIDGLSAVAVTATPQTANPDAPMALAAGDRLTLTTSSHASVPLSMEASLLLVRV